MTIEKIIDRLKKGEPFALSRFGDGEWQAILGYEGANCDGHKYYPEMGVALREIVKSNPEYHLSWHLFGDGLSGPHREEVLQWCENHDIKRDWGYTGIFHVAFKNKKDLDLIRLLEETPDVALVAPDYQHEWRGHDCHIVIPEKNCWLHKDAILEKIIERLEMYNVWLFAAGMPACWLIDEAYRANPYNTYIDVGVLLDPYCGVMNRSFHRKYRTNENFC